MRAIDLRLRPEFDTRGRQRQRNQFALQSEAQHFVHVIDKVQLHQIADVFGNIRQVLLIVLGDDYLVDAVPVSCKQLLFQASDR